MNSLCDLGRKSLHSEPQFPCLFNEVMRLTQQIFIVFSTLGLKVHKTVLAVILMESTI